MHRFHGNRQLQAESRSRFCYQQSHLPQQRQIWQWIPTSSACGPSNANNQWLDIDIPVGLDHYWELVQDQIVRLPELGLVAMSSVFGWLVSGPLKNYERSFMDAGNTFVIMTGSPPEYHFLTKFYQVIRKDHSTIKIRIVYDASAKRSVTQPSINDNLFSGPNLIADLMGMLLKLCCVVLLADIEKAFLQIGLQSIDRNAKRFFWLKDPAKPVSEDNIVVYRFYRIPFGATSSPFLLAATLQNHLIHSPTAVAKKLLGKFYVDNLVAGAGSLEEAQKFYREAKSEMDSIGMNLREWISNNKQLVESIPFEDRALQGSYKVLGMPWNTEKDVVYVNPVPEIVSPKPATKRQVLQAIDRVFDLLGLVSPVVIKAKIFIQQLWKLGMDWDNSLEEDLYNEWKQLNHQLSLLDQIKVPRCLTISVQSELHVFVDASAKAYAAVTYIRTIDGSRHGGKVAEFIKSNYPLVTYVQLWSDSKVVLYWISNPPQKHGVFVTNPIKVIKDFSFPFQYVPIKDNPADLPSRAVDVETLLPSSWLSGPPWLAADMRTWPPKYIGRSSGDPEEPPTIVIVSKTTANELEPPLGIDIGRYSTLTKLLRVTILCLKFIQRLKRQTAATDISAEELELARTKWVQFVKQIHYGDQLHLLKVNRADSVIRSLNLFLDNGIIRCKGRLSQAAVAEGANTPGLIPKKDKLTDLIIQDQHNRQSHQSVRHTLCNLRQTYWIPNGRQQVRFVLKRCGVCRLWDGGAYSLPPAPPMPSSRVTRGPAFTYSGCDLRAP